MATMVETGCLVAATPEQLGRVELGPDPSENVVEWDMIRRLRTHHMRVRRRTQPNALESLDDIFNSIELENITAGFDTGLRQILTKGDLDTLVEDGLKHQPEKAQSALKSLCLALDLLVKTDLLIVDSKVQQNIYSRHPYPKLLSLLHVLEKSNWNFEIWTGKAHSLFRLASKEEIVKSRQIVDNFNLFFAKAVQLPPLEQRQKLPDGPFHPRSAFGDQMKLAVKLLFQRLPYQTLEECQGHQALVKLPDWRSIDLCHTKQSPALELLISTCSDSTKWCSSHFDVQKATDSIEMDDRQAFCDDLEEADHKGQIFYFIGLEDGFFIPQETNTNAHKRESGQRHELSSNLKALIVNGSFTELESLTLTQKLKKIQRFERIEKRCLAAQLALNLSLCLGSIHSLNFHNSDDLFSLDENNKCKLNMVYARLITDQQGNEEIIHFDENLKIYADLGRLLLEIEFGESLEQLSSKDLSQQISDMLSLYQAETSLQRPMINIQDIEKRESYLDAVRELLDFKKTYRRISRKLRGKVNGVEQMAREIIFTEIAGKVRSAIPYIESSNPACPKPISRQEEAMRAYTRPSISYWEKTAEVNWSPKSTNVQRSKKTQIYLFDDVDNDDAVESVLHKRIRIAVLDTGINKSNGGIAGGFMLGRLQDALCYSWIGNESANMADNDGHGTNITNLLLRVAPEAELCICKVFSGSEYSVDEASNVAKAITHAVKNWDVDIITMSFGLKTPACDDEVLQQAFSDIDEAITNAPRKIFFAAAANHGSNGPRMFPAYHPDVICIHASTGKGKDGKISPLPEPADFNFMTLGMSVECSEGDPTTCKSGTSYAAPIAAGMAAHVIYITECLMELRIAVRRRIRTGAGMRAMFSLMCEANPSEGYLFVAPWVKLWKEDWHLDAEVIQSITSTISTHKQLGF